MITLLCCVSRSTFWICPAAIQDGGCKYGAMGREVQFYHACQVFSQLEVLPVRLPRELLHGTLSVTKANDMFVGQVGPGSPILLQLQIARLRSIIHLVVSIPSIPAGEFGWLVFYFLTRITYG